MIVTLNTDDPGMFGSDLAAEFQIASDVFGLSLTQLAQIRENAQEHRFRK